MDMEGIAYRLQTKFGLGTRPDLREALYARLQELVYGTHGEKAYQVIASVAADAVGKRDPGRYFAHVVTMRLQERGILPPPVEVF